MSRTLWGLCGKESAVIGEFAKDLDLKLVKRLQDLGLDLGCSIQCLRETPIQGPKVFQVCNSVFSLERSLAEKIFVQKAV